MAARMRRACLLLSVLSVRAVWAQNPYTADNPFELPPQPNGLEVDRPNMIMFMPDQLRFDSVGAFGNEIVKTPNIDAFAREGIKFTNTFAQASTCSQSRCSMFTGQYPHVSGHRTLENLLKPDEPNVFRSLKESGYHVAYLSPRGDFYAANATELGVNEYGFLTEQTLPSFMGEPEDVDKPNSIWNRLFYEGVRNASEEVDYDEFVTRGAIEWLECPPDGPWVLFLPLIFPHPPFTVEEPWFSLHDRKDMPLPVSLDEKTGHIPRFMPVNSEEYGLDRATPEIWQEVIATYYGMISRVDWQFGRVVNATKANGLWNNTITMFFTDHGEFLGDYTLIEKWPSGVSENLVHDPLLMAGGGLPQNVVFDEMAEMIDLVPTMLHLGQANTTYQQYGQSLVKPMLALGRGEHMTHRNFTFTEGGFLLEDEPLLEQGPYPYDIKTALQHNDTALVGKALAVRNLDWTYVYRLYEADELYARKNDIHELHNLAAEPEYAEIRTMMREVAFHWMVATPHPIPWHVDARAPEQVPLADPVDQYRARAEDCEECPPFEDPLGEL